MTQIDQREIREAIQAGEAALRSLERAMEKMGSAKNWGIFDMMGGGLFSSLFKHSKIDRASADIEEAKRQLAVFKRELEDVSISEDFSVGIGDGLRFIDTFLDNVFADVVVQSRINSAIERLDKVSGQVRGILTKLYSLLCLRNQLQLQ